MQTPLQITFKGVRHSLAIETAVREKAAKLDKHSGHRIISCRVIVREPNHRHRQGRLFAVTIDVSLPGAELAVGHDTRSEDQPHENVYFALRDAFHAMERQIQAYLAQRRQETKVHWETKHPARVTRIFPQDGYGFITTPEGREIYFHSNAVRHGEGFEALDVGAEVLFIEELGDNGPQATVVQTIKNSIASAAS